MLNPRFESLKDQLRWRGVSPRRAQRFVSELQDHFLCLRDDFQWLGLSSHDAASLAHERLGTDAMLVQSLLRDLRNVSVAHRHPVALFVLAPLPAAVAILLVCALVVWAGVVTFGQSCSSFLSASEANTIADVAELVSIMAVSALAISLCWIALHHRLSYKWPLIACIIIAFLCPRLFVGMQLPDAGPGSGVLALSMFYSTPGLISVAIPAIAFTVYLIFFRSMIGRHAVSSSGDQSSC